MTTGSVKLRNHSGEVVRHGPHAASRSTSKRAMIVSAFPKPEIWIMAQFVAATSPTGEASYLINPDKITYIMQTLKGESENPFRRG